MPDPAFHLDAGLRYLRGGATRRAHRELKIAARYAPDAAFRSETLRHRADAFRREARWSEALTFARESQRVALEQELTDHAAAARNIEGTVYLQQGRFHEADGIYRAALALNPGARQRGLICQNLGTSAALQRDFTSARRWYTASHAAFADGQYERESILVLNNLAGVLLDEGRIDEAVTTLETAHARISGSRHGMDHELEALILLNLAEALARGRSDLGRAQTYALRAIGHFRASGNQPHQVSSYRVLALVAEAETHPDVALAACERGLALARDIGALAEVQALQEIRARLEGRAQAVSIDHQEAS